MKKFWDLFLVLIALIVIISFLLFTDSISNYLFPSNKDKVGELAKLVLSILGGLCVFFGLIISNRRAKSTDESVKLQTQVIELNRKSQIDERFKNAIEHLGEEKEPVILGGIAELVQIAKEDPGKYSEIVFNILCSYIRAETNIYKKTANEINTTIVQTIINELFKSSSSQIFRNFDAILNHSNLMNQNLRNCNFEGADFSFSLLSHLENCILNRANLSKSEIAGSYFFGNSLIDTDMRNASFVFLDFKDSIFDRVTSLNGANFINCKFHNASFRNVQLYNCKFICSYFNNCNFENSEIMKTSFATSNLRNIDFSKVQSMAWVDFRATGLKSINMSTYIQDVKFNGCCCSDTEGWYIINNHLLSRKGKIGEISEITLISSLMNKCLNDKLSEDDCLEIQKIYDDIYKTDPLPRGKKIKKNEA